MATAVAVFSAKPYDENVLEVAAKGQPLTLHFFALPLNPQTVHLSQGMDAVCVFVNDELSEPVLNQLARLGVRQIALRCAGFNQVDIPAAKALGLQVSRVPAYSPHTVAEHTLALILTLNRKTHRAYNRVREGNFALQGLLGFTLHGKVAGVIGTGHIGAACARLLLGFGCKVLACDPQPDPKLARDGVSYVGLSTLLTCAHIVTLHCPLTADTRYMIDASALSQMPRGAMLINTSRGALVDTRAVVAALKSGQLGYLGIDVYEQEGPLFFADHSDDIIDDDLFGRLTTFPNVLVTGHQGFFTAEALAEIAQTTISNLCAARLPDANRVV